MTQGNMTTDLVVGSIESFWRYKKNPTEVSCTTIGNFTIPTCRQLSGVLAEMEVYCGVRSQEKSFHCHLLQMSASKQKVEEEEVVKRFFFWGGEEDGLVFHLQI